MSKKTDALLGVIAGTALGAALGILFAPDKGSNTRQRIADEAVSTKDKLVEKATDLKDRVVTSASSKKETFDEQVETLLSDASYKADDVISSLERKLKDLKEKNKRLQKTS